MRKLVVAGAILAFLVVVILAVTLLSLNRIIAHNRGRILQHAEAIVGRPLAIDTMTMSFWGGIGVRLGQVRIADDPDFSTSDFLRATAVIARADLWPLLRRNLRIDRIDIIEPHVQVIRDASGRWNYATLKPLRPDAGSARSTEPAIMHAAAFETTAAAPLPLLVSRITIEDGTLAVTDRSRAPAQTMRVEQIDLVADDISLTTPIRFMLDAAFEAPAPNVHVRGQLGPLRDRASIPVEIDGALGPLGSRQIRVDDLRIQAIVTPEAVRATHVQARAFGGSMALDGQYPLQREGAVVLKGRLIDVAVAKVLEVSMADAARRITGSGQLTLDLRATGDSAEALQSTLSGTLAADVKNGVVKDFNVANEVLARLTSLPVIGNLVSTTVKPKYARLFSETETQFQTLRGSFRIADQRLQTDDLTAVATDYGVRVNGWIAFNRDVDLSGTLAMSQQFSRDVAADVKEAKFLMDERGQLSIPFRLRGKIGESKPQPDMAYVVAALARGVSKGGAKDLLDKLFGGKSKRPTPGAGQPTDLLDQGLRDLLGR